VDYSLSPSIYWLISSVAIVGGVVGAVVAFNIRWRNVRPIANRNGDAPAKQAVGILSDMLIAFENGDAAGVAAGIEPTLIGRAMLLKSINDSYTWQRSIRIQLDDIEVTAGADAVLASAKWEKRYVSNVESKPGMATGHATFVFCRTDAHWKLVGMSGDNVFFGGLR
jgi:ketosteroid isomerase-like protein